MLQIIKMFYQIVICENTLYTNVVFFTAKLKIYYIYFLVLSFSFVSIVPTYVQVSCILL